MHLSGHIIGSKADSLNLAGEPHNGVIWSDECFESDSGLGHYSLADYQKPLIGAGFDPETFANLVDLPRNNYQGDEHPEVGVGD